MADDRPVILPGGVLPDPSFRIERREVSAHADLLRRLDPHLSHLAGCAALCVECGGDRGNGRHRESWVPGSGVFWHDFTPKARCTCGRDEALAAIAQMAQDLERLQRMGETAQAKREQAEAQLREAEARALGKCDGCGRAWTADAAGNPIEDAFCAACHEAARAPLLALVVNPAALIEAIDAVSLVEVCECGSPKSEHTFWNDRIYDVQGLKCPTTFASEYRFSPSITETRHKTARVAKCAAELDAALRVAPDHNGKG